MYKEIITITGQELGPTSIILAGVHGNEVCGIHALEKIIPTLSLDRGTVLFGYGSPRAIAAKTRFMDVNLNRLFKDDQLLTVSQKESYEYHRAQFLKPYLDQAEALLDVHASNTPDSMPFAICEENAGAIVSCLPFDLNVAGFDALEPGSTIYYMNRSGKIGICVECGYVADPQSLAKAEETIFNFLMARGHIAGNVQNYTQKHIQMHTIYHTKTDHFVLSKLFDDFEPVTKGQVVGVDGNETVKADEDGVILFARNREKVGDEAFLLGRQQN